MIKWTWLIDTKTMILMFKKIYIKTGYRLIIICEYKTEVVFSMRISHEIFSSCICVLVYVINLAKNNTGNNRHCYDVGCISIIVLYTSMSVVLFVSTSAFIIIWFFLSYRIQY